MTLNIPGKFFTFNDKDRGRNDFRLVLYLHLHVRAKYSLLRCDNNHFYLQNRGGIRSLRKCISCTVLKLIFVFFFYYVWLYLGAYH